MTEETIPMKAIVVTDQAAGTAGMTVVERPELAGVVTALGYGTTGLSVGQRVFGLTDWHRDRTLAAP
jgi:NADPH:quinone reductase-like Zn-dependent oxidoreductase